MHDAQVFAKSFDLQLPLRSTVEVQLESALAVPACHRAVPGLRDLTAIVHHCYVSTFRFRQQFFGDFDELVVMLDWAQVR